MFDTSLSSFEVSLFSLKKNY